MEKMYLFSIFYYDFLDRIWHQLAYLLVPWKLYLLIFFNGLCPIFKWLLHT